MSHHSNTRSAKIRRTRIRVIGGTVFVLTSIIAAMFGLCIGFGDPLPSHGGGPPPETVHLSPVGGSMPNPKEYESVVSKSRNKRQLRFIRSNAKAPFVSEYRNYTRAAVTTDTYNCSNIAVNIMRDRGGSAVDAAIATYLCTCIFNAHSSGIGGGFFATIYERPRGKSEKVVVTVMGRSRAPAAAYKDMFVNNSNASSVGGLSVAVPGEVSGLYKMWEMFGRLPWSELFQPTIARYEQGFVVEKALEKAINSNQDDVRKDPYLKELFVKGDGRLVQAGDVLKDPKLGATFRAIAADPFAFYNGSLAADIIRDLNEHGSIITAEDLSQYESQIKPPLNVSLSHGKYTVFSGPPPASGAVLNLLLNILNNYKLSPASIFDTPSKILTYHRIIEAFKFAYAKRSELGDEDFVNVTQLLMNLTSDSYAEQLRKKIDDNRTHDIDYYEPGFDVKSDAGTAHINVLASDGAAVSMTGTINTYFGAKFRGRRTGIIFNNDMDDFSVPGTRNYYGLPASPSNYIKPGKVPMSSMCPALILNERGAVVLVTGAAGGTKITSATALIAIHSLWFGMDLGSATDIARIHHQLVPNEVAVESWMEQAVVEGLKAKNHKIVDPTGISVVGSIRSRCLEANSGAEACIEAVSDGRKGGTPDGYGVSSPQTSSCRQFSGSIYSWLLSLLLLGNAMSRIN